VTYVVKKYRRQ